MLSYEELFQKIKNTYGSPWPDQAFEKEASYQILDAALKTRETTVDVLLQKARAAALTHGVTKCKTSNLIDSRYWEVSYPCELREWSIPRYNPHQL